MDGDRSKAVNDTYGHPVGDDALVPVARIVQAAALPGETVVRLGGDEPAVLVPGPERTRSPAGPRRSSTRSALEPRADGRPAVS